MICLNSGLKSFADHLNSMNQFFLYIYRHKPIMNRKNFLALIAFTFLFFSTIATTNASQNGDPWTADQLMEPQALVNIIRANKSNALPVILNIGSVDAIKGAITTGAVSDPEGFAELKKQLKGIKKDKLIVIYCGCCPLFKCPNVRPAFKELAAEGFTNIKVLNLKKNLQTDWVDKNYPMQDAR